MMIKTKLKYKKAFTMVELMLILVVFSLILASSFSVITRKHKLKPTRALHGEYLCYNGDISEFKDKDGNSYSGTGNIEVYYQGNTQVRRGVTDNDGKAPCNFQLPSNATYYLVRMVGGGGAGGNANYAPDKANVTVSDIGDDPIVVNLIKGTVENGSVTGGGDVMALQPYYGNQGYNACKDRNSIYNDIICHIKNGGDDPFGENARSLPTGVLPRYVESKFLKDGTQILSADTFKSIVNDFFGQGFQVSAYDYAGSGQSGIAVRKARGLEARNCKGSNRGLADCFNQYVRDIGLVTDTTGDNPFYTDGCVAIGKGELTDEQLGETQQKREEKLASYCPIFFNDYWIPSQDQGNFHICESGKGGRGAMFVTSALSNFAYGMSALVGNRMNIDFYQEPVQNYRYDTVPSIRYDAVTLGEFNDNCNPPNICRNFTKKDNSQGQLQFYPDLSYIPLITSARYDFSRTGYSFPEVDDLVRLTYNQLHSEPLAEGEVIPAEMNPKGGRFPYLSRRLGSPSFAEGSNNNAASTGYRLRLFYINNNAKWSNESEMKKNVTLNDTAFGQAGENLNNLSTSWCENTTDSINYDIPNGEHVVGTCQYIGQFRGCPNPPAPANNGNLIGTTLDQLSRSLCIANLRFYAPNRNIDHLRKNLNLKNRYKNADGEDDINVGNVANDDKYEHSSPYTKTLLPFQCRPFSEPYNVYKNAGFIDSPSPLYIEDNEFALKFLFKHNNKIMTYGEPGNPGEYREFYTRATSSNRLYIQPGQGGRPEEVTDETLGNTETIYINFINRNPITVEGRDPRGGDTNIFFNCQEDKEKLSIFNAKTCQNHVAHGNAGGRSGLLETKDELIYSQDDAGKIAQRLAQGNLGEHPFPRYSYNASIDNDSDFFGRVKAFVDEYISSRQSDGARSPGEVLYNPDAGKGAQTRFSIISDLLNIPNMEGAISNFGKGGDAGYGWDDCWIGQRVLLMYMPQLFEGYIKYPGSDYAYVKDTHFSQLMNSNISACKTGDSWWGNEPGENGGGGAVLITW